MEKIMNYESPLVEMVEVEVEQGFAASGGGDDWTGSQGQG